MQIGRRIYYEKSTGNVILDTEERSGNVRETTVDEDFENYVVLAQRVRETVGYIELEYGQYAEDFAVCNGYRVNPETLEIEFSYPDPNDPEPTPVYRRPLTEEVEFLQKQNAAMQEAINLLLGL
jgi:hypothetical protein